MFVFKKPYFESANLNRPGWASFFAKADSFTLALIDYWKTRIQLSIHLFFPFCILCIISIESKLFKLVGETEYNSGKYGK